VIAEHHTFWRADRSPTAHRDVSENFCSSKILLTV